MATGYPSNAYQFRGTGGTTEALENWVAPLLIRQEMQAMEPIGRVGDPEDNVVVGEVGDSVVVVTPPPHQFQS